MLGALSEWQTTYGSQSNPYDYNPQQSYNPLTFRSHSHWATERSMFDFSDGSISAHSASLHYQPVAMNILFTKPFQ